MNLCSVLSFIILSLSSGECLRCFSCRSDDQLNCGDPFYGSSIPVEECSNVYTFDTFLCYKARHYVGGIYTTVRGCAPFNSETFDPKVQKTMQGTFWKSISSGNLISFCDSNNCNAAANREIYGFFVVISLLVHIV